MSMEWYLDVMLHLFPDNVSSNNNNDDDDDHKIRRIRRIIMKRHLLCMLSEKEDIPLEEEPEEDPKLTVD